MSVTSWKEVGARLKALRLARDIPTQAALAQMIGAEFPQYNNWERGAGQLPVTFAMEVCRVTGCTLDYIYRGEMSALPTNLVTLLSTSSSEHTRKRG